MLEVDGKALLCQQVHRNGVTRKRVNSKDIESLGLELSILARGLPAENLPTDLLSRSHPGYRIYADDAQLSNQFEGASIVGQLRQSFVFVASRPGSIALPHHCDLVGYRRESLA